MRPIRLLIAMGMAIGWSVTAAGPAAADVIGPCTAQFNGIDVSRIDSLSSQLELDVADDLVFSGVDPARTSRATVDVLIGPITVESVSTAYDPSSEAFTAIIDLDDVAPYTVGLVRIRGETDGCVADAWLRITGRFPLTALAGITAAGLTVAGITGQLGAIASRRRWSRAASALGGIATGAGGAVVGQQFGLLQLSYISVTLVVVMASSLGFFLAGLLSPGQREKKRKVAVERAPREIPAITVAAADRLGEGTDGPPAPEHRFSAAPYWCYVLAETDVLDLTDHTRVVSRLKPGVWYLAKREAGPWLHISTGEGIEGWVSRASVQRHG
jgi:hypothetical protein